MFCGSGLNLLEDNRLKPMSQLLAPSSIGEALDRLTILQLKLQFIQDKRRDDVQREYADLFELVKDFIAKDPYHYEKLLLVNKIMWEIQDILHEGKARDKDHEYDLMKELAVQNQRRFRIKRTLNENLGSKHREQKGYKGKKLFLLPHLGMGDQLFLNGAVRFFATYYDEVCLVIKKATLENVKTLYKDEPSVTFYPISDDNEISPKFGCPIDVFEKATQGFDGRGLCGFHTHSSQMDVFPFNFYSDLGLSKEIMMEWSLVPRLSHKLPSIPYVFYNNTSSNQTMTIPIDIEAQLVLNPAVNMYPVEHPWHPLAQEWVGLPLFEYTGLLKGAQKLLMVDSSFFCMAILLGLKPDVWCRNGRTYKHVVPDLVEH
jgi:hypothetical protein